MQVLNNQTMQKINTDCSSVKFMDYVLKQAEEIKSQERYSTADNYLCAIRSFSHWIGRRKCDLPTVSDEMMWHYSKHLSENGVGRNTISCYLRCLRAAYNRAVEEGLTPQNNPFRNVWTGVDKTVKRSIPDSLISEMKDLQLPQGSEIDLARDLYLFSFSMRGMAFVDIAYLKKKDISCGTVKYSRRKTGQTLIIKLEPFQKRIVKKYESNDSKYVFPLIHGETSLELYESYRSALRTYNCNLKTIAKMLRTRIRLTSYTARHSWATSARNHSVPIQVISAGLGHTSCRTTEIYLSALEDNVVDAANRKLLRSIFSK